MNNRISSNKLPILLVVIGALISISAFAYFLAQNQITLYPDAQSHLMIARRVCDSSSVGLAQLGAVWLPLTHLMSLPLVCSDVFLQPFGDILLTVVLVVTYFVLTHFSRGRLSKLAKLLFYAILSIGITFLCLNLQSGAFYTSGAGQSVISMVAYVLLGLFTYKLVAEATGDLGAGVVAWLVVMTNPNLIYLQSTPMSEVPLFFGIVLSMYTFFRLSKEPSNLTWIFWSGVAAFIMTTVRYEGWVILLVEAGIYGFILLRKKFDLATITGHVAIWSFVSFSGLLGWLAWNQTIFGTPLEFQNGTYSKPSNWVAGTEAAVGNIKVSFLTYSWGVWDTIGPIIIIGILALVIYLIINRLRKESFAPLLPLILFPFFVFMFYKGQRPMQAVEIEGNIYNARFALVMLFSIAPLIGFMTKGRTWVKVVVVICLILSNVFLLQSTGTITLREPILASASGFSALQKEAALWLKVNYDNKPLLLESYGNEQVQFLSEIHLRNVIYEGTYQKWDSYLIDPYENGIEWILMRGSTANTANSMPDLVWQTLQDDQEFRDHYSLVFENPAYQIYKLKAE